MKEFTIIATTRKDLAIKLELLFGWKIRRITQNYILFRNFEKIYFSCNNNFYCTIEDTKYKYNKALKLRII
jgi:hypothetical protein